MCLLQNNKRGYKFTYDDANRLTQATYGRGNAISAAGAYTEGVQYDAHGNITGIPRYGKTSSSTYGKMDDLTLSYSGNRLTGVTEASADYDFAGSFEYKRANGSQYLYNANGSLIADKSRGIAYITYDTNGNPGKIYFTNGNVTKYVYSATGQKLSVEYYVAAPNVTVPFGTEPDALTQGQTMYAGSRQYLLGGSLVMEDGMIDRFLFNGGYASASMTSPTTYTFSFYYYNQDHLGNNREVVDSAGTVKQITHYYPFGTPYADPSTILNPSLQPYKYNGKELDRMHGLDTYDYGARQYNPVTARWDRMDPLCEKYYGVSPYVYCHDNPVMFIDPNGKNDYRFDSKTGTFHLMEKTEDSKDNVYTYKYDKKTGQYRKKKGIFSSQMTNIEKGILKDGLNLKDNDLLISVGGEDNPSVQGVKEFAMGLSELVNREIAGLGYSADGSGNVSDIVIGKYKNNTYTSSKCNPGAIAKKYKENFTSINLYLNFHTHPDGKLGATESAPELSDDIQIMRGEKNNMPKATFLVLYRPSYEMEEYDYTNN